MAKQISPKEHKRQIAAYVKEMPHYQAYARAMERVLSAACEVSIPERIVQARPKSVSSFAEKCVRKFDKYPDPVNQLTDLCGARVILPTLEHVGAIQQFVDFNFEVVERDDKTKLLGEGEFGYRDMHYLIRLKPDRAQIIGFTADECQVIGQRVAELQVRSVVQHAWADILHDRMYKAPLKLSSEMKRTGALLAAIMEDGDRSFNLLAGQLDGMFANFSAYASRENVEREIEVQSLLLDNAAEHERPRIALRLARLIASKGEWQNIITTLRPYQKAKGPLKPALLLELGHALCRCHRGEPTSDTYREGQELLQEVVNACEHPDLTAVPDLRRIRSVHSRALARLGWSWEPLEAEAYRARSCYRKAVELEPGNPYYLTDMLGFEIKFAAGADIAAGLRTSINSALATCQQHTTTGTELPAACFTAARLNMLLEEYYSALNDYACGIRYWLSQEGCTTCNLLEDEIAWLHRVNPGKPLPEPFLWAEKVLQLCQPNKPDAGGTKATALKTKAPVLVLAGGAANFKAERLPQVEELLDDALSAFTGTIISGGTVSGVPGCVGKVAEKLAQAGRKRFKLTGYIPHSCPNDGEKDRRYDEQIICGADRFTPIQVLEAWTNLVADGIEAKDVLLLGFGGGKISAFEYRLALALGATVGVITWEKDAADQLLKDPLWGTSPNLYPLPVDAKTIRAFLVWDGYPFGKTELEEMAKEFHERYRNKNLRKTKPDNLKLWEDLPTTYKTSNEKQASYSIRILNVAGFNVDKVEGQPVIFREFTDREVELMAALEHGRWNIERLRDGWRPGRPRDDAKKIHDCLVAWKDLPEEIKRHDRDAVRAFPEILAIAGLQVSRKPKANSG